MITLEAGQYGWDFILRDNSGRERMIESDWDYPSIAALFGWAACECRATDGTVDCPHKTATAMIVDALQYLVDHVGEEVEGSLAD